MTRPYEEIFDGETVSRSAPGERHEQICLRLHQQLSAAVKHFPAMQLLPPRTALPVIRGSLLCPDLALVTAATQKLFLAVEVVSRDDHKPDTVMKKDIYERIRVPRLWMVDPRYDNVEIYHSFDFGLKLHGILARGEKLTEKLVPRFELGIAELFAT